MLSHVGEVILLVVNHREAFKFGEQGLKLVLRRKYGEQL
jgi:hypothetical protein